MIIIIDYGHGVKDSGAIGFNRREADLVRFYGAKIAKLLSSYANVTIILQDKGLELNERAKWIKTTPHDLCISCHVNASNGAGHGTEIIYSAFASDSIKSLANKLGNKISFNLSLTLRRVFERLNSAKSADYYALHRMGSNKTIIIEPFFIDNKQDFIISSKPLFYDKLASVIVSTIAMHYDLKNESEVLTMDDLKKILDIKDASWATDEIKKAKLNGIINSDHDTNEIVTFGLFMKVINNLYEKLKADK